MKTKKPANPVVMILDDNQVMSEFYRDEVKRFIPGAKCVLVKDNREAFFYDGRVDYLVVDISSMAGCSMMAYQADSHVAAFIGRHPGTEVVLCSGHPRELLEEVRDSVVERKPDTVIHVCGSGDSLEESFRTIVTRFH